MSRACTALSKHWVGVEPPFWPDFWDRSRACARGGGVLWKKPEKCLATKFREVRCVLQWRTRQGEWIPVDSAPSIASAAPNGALPRGAIGISTALTGPDRTPRVPNPRSPGLGTLAQPQCSPTSPNAGLGRPRRMNQAPQMRVLSSPGAPRRGRNAAPACTPSPPSRRERSRLLSRRHWQASWRSARRWGPPPWLFGALPRPSARPRTCNGCPCPSPPSTSGSRQARGPPAYSPTSPPSGLVLLVHAAINSGYGPLFGALVVLSWVCFWQVGETATIRVANIALPGCIPFSNSKTGEEGYITRPLSHYANEVKARAHAFMVGQGHKFEILVWQAGESGLEVGMAERRTPERTGKHRSAQENTGAHMRTKERTGEHRSAQENTGAHMRTEERTGEHRSAPENTGPHWRTPERTREHKSAQENAGAHMRTQERVGERRSV